MKNEKPLLEVLNYKISSDTADLVKNLNFELFSGEILGVVGESGSGKSISALSLSGLLPKQLTISEGRVFFRFAGERERSSMDLSDFRQMRRDHIGFVFQEPMSALNPVKSCGWQLTESIGPGIPKDKKKAKEIALQWIKKVALPDPERIFKAYPHQLSGGQRQRLMIAMAMIRSPKLLIADEPTTALDVKVRDTILQLMKDLCAENNTAMILISHDLQLIATYCQNILVLKDGEVQDFGPTETVINAPKSAYTKALWACRPSDNPRYKRLPTVQEFLSGSKKIQKDIILADEWCEQAEELRKQAPLLRVNNLYYSYKDENGTQNQVIKNTSFELYPGESLGLVGESGCGKSTLSRIIWGIEKPDSGQMIWQKFADTAHDLGQFSRKERARHIQMIFQDPLSTLNPHHTIGKTLEDVLKHFYPKMKKKERLEKIVQMLEKTGLDPKSIERYPHTFSGGQRQRINIARALLVQPQLLLCDESVSALDVSVQAQILNLLNDLKEEFNLSILFISHDPETVRYFCHRSLRMEKGEIVAVE